MSNSIKHRTVYNAIRQEILSGKYDGAVRLPSEGQLVRRFAVSRPTVIHALDELEKNGFIVRIKGSGSYLSLRMKKGGQTFGMIVSNDNANLSVFPDICNAFAEACRRNGATALYNTTNPGDFPNYAEQASYLAGECIAKKVSGVIFQPVDVVKGYAAANRRIIAKLREAKIPVVLIDCDWAVPPDRSDCDVVEIDNVLATWRLGRHLIAAGARRFLFVAFEDSAPTVMRRLLGMRAALQDADLPFDVLTMKKWDGTSPLAPFIRGELKKARAAKTRLAVVSSNDIVAAKLLQQLSANGLSAPKNLLVAGFDDTKYAALLAPPLTSVHQPTEALGFTAYDCLMRRIANPNASPCRMLLPAPLVVRESTGGAGA